MILLITIGIIILLIILGVWLSNDDDNDILGIFMIIIGVVFIVIAPIITLYSLTETTDFVKDYKLLRYNMSIGKEIDQEELYQMNLRILDYQYENSRRPMVWNITNDVMDLELFDVNFNEE